MKHSLLYIFILAIMTGLLSCSKELEQDGGLVSDMPLVFSPTADWPQMGSGDLSGSGTRSGNGTWNGTGTGAVTKALVESAEDLKQYGISLFATATKGEDTYPVFNNDNLKFTGDSWNYDITKYWIPGASYSFAAFAPYAGTAGQGVKLSNGTVSVSATATAPSITITDYNSGKGNNFDARCEDLLYAAHFRDNTNASNYSAVPLQFEHLLSCITFYIRNATNYDIASIDNIKLGGLEYQCTINVSPDATYIEPIELGQLEDSSPYFTGERRPVTGETTPFLPKGMSEQQAKPLFDCTYLTVIPQNTFGKNDSENDINITLSFRVHYTAGDAGVEYTGNLSNIDNIPRWEAGKKYRYNITISSQDIIFQVQEVPWIEHEVEL